MKSLSRLRFDFFSSRLTTTFYTFFLQFLVLRSILGQDEKSEKNSGFYPGTILKKPKPGFQKFAPNRGLQPTQNWVGRFLITTYPEIKLLLWNAMVLSNIYLKSFLIKWKLWKFIIRRYNLCSKIWPFHVILNFYNFASKYTKFLNVTQNGWLS